MPRFPRGCAYPSGTRALGIAFGGEELDRAAVVSARLTHGHPNASLAAVATCRLLRAALLEGRFDAALVREVLGGLPAGGPVPAALEAALAQAGDPREGWLDEGAIPEGDGGWRSPSALGLAVAAALRWGSDFSTAVEKAARIDGDSDSVAAITGMLLGAAGGTAALPAPWVAAVRDRARIEALAGRLALRGQPWLAVSDLHGRPDRLLALVAWADARMTGPRIALLGDYVDNGPEVPALLDLVLRLMAERGDDLVAIAGNHDLACSRALETLGTPEGRFWSEKWSRGHWGAFDTPGTYGARARDIPGLAARMPEAHRRFLADLPWSHDTGRWLFVHAGLEAGPMGPQLALLGTRPAAVGRYLDDDGRDRGLPAQVRGHALDRVADPSWERVVVTAHSRRQPWPAFVGPHRIGLQASDAPEADVVAVLLPDRVFLRAGPGGEVHPVVLDGR